MNKFLVGIILLTASSMALSHYVGWTHCHGVYQIMFDSWNVPYHQHVGWWHY